MSAIELIPRGSRRCFVLRILNASGMLCVAMLSACSTVPKAVPAPASLQSIGPPRTAAEQPPEPATTPAASAPDAEVVAAGEIDPWTRIRNGARFTRCDPLPSLERQIERYRREGPALSAQLARALPRMDYVLGALEDAGLPAEFALLPLVESGYRAAPTSGNRPAGIWQFMPTTARASGLHVGPTYDGRLDLAMSTAAAIRLLTRLGEVFADDWMLVTMAYNAGEFRVRRALAGKPAAGAETLWQDLPLSRTTHTHLARLLALSCVIQQPRPAAIALPVIAPDERLSAVALDAPVDLALAARLARIDQQQLRELNPAHTKPRMQRGDRLMVPTVAVGRLHQGLALLAPSARIGWRVSEGLGERDWHALATAQVNADTLAAVHGMRIDDPLPSMLLLPPTPNHEQTLAGDGEAYIVRRGDSLWSIARRLGVGMRELATSNGIPLGKLLRPGQVLRLPTRQ